jgi:hypothetical protein
MLKIGSDGSNERAVVSCNISVCYIVVTATIDLISNPGIAIQQHKKSRIIWRLKRFNTFLEIISDLIK